MDDELLPNCLNRISKEYESGKWMTYGNWIDQHKQGLPAGFNLYFDKEIHDNNRHGNSFDWEDFGADIAGAGLGYFLIK